MSRLSTAVAAALIPLALTACGGSASPGRVSAPPTSTAVPATSAAVPSAGSTPGAGPSSYAPPTPSAGQQLVTRGEASGRLPQTLVRPAEDALFRARVQALWTAMTTRDPLQGQGFFFPLAAYRQVKALADPAGDYRDRLLRLYRLDLAAVAATVPRGSTLLGATVPVGAAVQVPPGAETNALGYWRVNGTRVRYRTPAGAVRSFGVCSMISWRGEWYGVHLGPVLRSAPGGQLCR